MAVPAIEYVDDSASPEPQYEKKEEVRRRRRAFGQLTLCCLPFRSREPLYGALPQGNAIRLLRIHAGSKGSEIRCTLHTATLHDKNLSYEALSYVWGHKEGQKWIICNGNKTEVRTNLFDALERLRHPLKIRTLWVDALCINQGDLHEKDKHVRKMNHIYRKATRVVVWLGTDDENQAPRAFSTLCLFVNASNTQGPPATYSTIRKIHAYCIRCTHRPPPLDSAEWKVVHSLFLNRWWLRMWVLQEIVLARRALFIWGAAELDWGVIGKAIDLIVSQPYLYNLLENQQFQNAHLMHALAKRHSSDGKGKTGATRGTHPFLHLLDVSRSFEVTYPEDRIYALLGFPNADDPGIESVYNELVPSEYGAPVSTVYKHVARKIIQRDGNLGVLSYTSHISPDFHLHLCQPENEKAETGSLSLSLPTWVPDWNSKTMLFSMADFADKNRLRAGTHRPVEIDWTEDPDILRVKGVVVDTVRATSATLSLVDYLQSAPDLQKLLHWCTDPSFQPTASDTTNNTTTPLPIPSPTHLARTLSGCRDREGMLIPESSIDVHGADLYALLVSWDAKRYHSMWPAQTRALRDLARRKGDPDRVAEAVWKMTVHRRAFWTEGGRLGLGPGAAREGDRVVVLWGGEVVYLVRKVEVSGDDGKEGKGGKYVFVGDCYVDGFMNGEVDEGEGVKYGEEVFELV